MPNWHFKRPGRTPSIQALCLYGAGRCHAFQRAAQQACAVQVNIEIMRAFVRLKKLISPHEELAGKIERLERKYDVKFKAVFDAIRQLMQPARKSKDRIGF